MKGNAAFKTGNKHGDVVLNFHHIPKDDFGSYAEAYHEAAKILAKNMEAKGIYSDLDACPIVFLYLHALELVCKGILLINKDLKNGISFKEDELWKHGVVRLLPKIKSIFEHVGWRWDKGLGGFSDFEDLIEYLKSVEVVDPRSFSFRYPIDKRNNSPLPKNFAFNAIDFSRKMDELLEVFEDAMLGLQEIWDAVCENEA